MPLTVHSQAPPLPEQDYSTYLGFEYGGAGIAKTLIKVYPILPVKLQGEVNRSLSQFYQGLLNERINDLYGTPLSLWRKTVDNYSVIYVGDKYGQSGIINSLLSYYNFSKNRIWFDQAQSALNLLFTRSILDGNKAFWGYADSNVSKAFGIPLSGLEFGSAGILGAVGSLYKLTKNQTYLKWGEKVVNWLYSISTKHQSGISIPWYPFEKGFAGVEIYGYGKGMAGIALSLQNFAGISQNSSILDFSKKVYSYLVSRQLPNGLWNTENDTTELNYNLNSGVSGILESLGSSQTDYSKEIQTPLQLVMNKLSSVSPYFHVQPNSSIQLNSLSSGVLGVFDFLLSSYNKLTRTQQTSLKSAFLDFLNSQIVNVTNVQTGSWNYYLIHSSNKEDRFFDLSYSEGIAGVLQVLAKNYETLRILQLSGIVNNTIQRLTTTLLDSQNSNGLWVRQIKNSGILSAQFDSKTTPVPFTIISFVIFTLILVIIRKLKR